jgi:hypothetical protein
MHFKKYLRARENEKKRKIEASAWKLPKISHSNYIYGAHHTIFATGPLVPSYAIDRVESC